MGSEDTPEDYDESEQENEELDLSYTFDNQEDEQQQYNRTNEGELSDQLASVRISKDNKMSSTPNTRSRKKKGSSGLLELPHLLYQFKDVHRNKMVMVEIHALEASQPSDYSLSLKTNRGGEAGFKR